MSIRPELLDGVPEEPGYYFVFDQGWTVWEPFKVFKFGDYLEAYPLGMKKRGFIPQHNFQDYTWSESILPPEGGEL